MDREDQKHEEKENKKCIQPNPNKENNKKYNKK